jgi:hypothetical protein
MIMTCSLFLHLLFGQGVDQVLADGGKGPVPEMPGEPFDVADVILGVGAVGTS